MFFQKTNKAAKEITKTGIAMSFGSQILGSEGATHAQKAVGNISKRLPTLGSAVGVGMTLDAIGHLQKKMKKKY